MNRARLQVVGRARRLVLDRMLLPAPAQAQDPVLPPSGEPSASASTGPSGSPSSEPRSSPSRIVMAPVLLLMLRLVPLRRCRRCL
jgi:hypothetical protein